MNPGTALRFLIALASLTSVASRIPGHLSVDLFQDLNRSLSLTRTALSRRGDYGARPRARRAHFRVVRQP
jgi:hypothetical protein